MSGPIAPVRPLLVNFNLHASGHAKMALGIVFQPFGGLRLLRDSRVAATGVAEITCFRVEPGNAGLTGVAQVRPYKFPTGDTVGWRAENEYEAVGGM